MSKQTTNSEQPDLHEHVYRCQDCGEIQNLNDELLVIHDQAYQDGIKAALEALPEKELSNSIPPGMPDTVFRQFMGHDQAIDQTRTNLERLIKE